MGGSNVVKKKKERGREIVYILPRWGAAVLRPYVDGLREGSWL